MSLLKLVLGDKVE